MKDTEKTIKSEAELIRQIKEGDDEALINLCQLYKPLINKIKSIYHVRYYDNQDWEQDAMIICHESATSFDLNKGKFSSYYKTRLTNHARSLVRYDNAYRRQALKQSISLETAKKNHILPLNKSFASIPEIPLSENIAILTARLSDLEINALLVGLGIKDQEDVINNLKISQLTLARARSRLVQKMRQTLLS